MIKIGVYLRKLSQN